MFPVSTCVRSSVFWVYMVGHLLLRVCLLGSSSCNIYFLVSSCVQGIIDFAYYKYFMHHLLESQTKFLLYVQILDRKNSEIEDVKSHYRSKTKELEETITKLERKGTACSVPKLGYGHA